ncbi:cupin domain-containing protein [Bdellovibrio sp. SKB1291214]|uniref:JmjC domain-containing protein n=1 Tax=Bdellovibrio sp. SKB1291214 TaxID=1732569 RepID=UPI000B51A79F|nr:cupin domain-containing protein [Bdellovibrio sp. SKB1291214]UYL09329.1 cupin domain-containing protein [Bdellovibrio sp. SKB1291214]
MKSALLDQKFWRHFAKNHWEKKPLLLRNVKSDLIEMTADEIFDLLVLYADRCRQINDPTGFKFYTDGIKAQEEDVLSVLPEKSDKSLAGYHKRMNTLFSDYCLVCDELLQVNLKKQHLLTDFTDQLYRHVGFPNRFSEMGLYLGNYKKTPFGVHVDSCGVFSFPVAGTKKFRLWNAAYGEKHPELDRTFNYEKNKKHSQLLEVGPGDMTYWPSSEWHIAESDGSFSATWSLGVWVDQPHKDMVSDSVKELLDKKLGSSGTQVMTAFKRLHNKSGEITGLPKSFSNSLKLLQNLSPLELQDILSRNWMKHISLQGFKTMPYEALELSAKSCLHLRNDRSPILWQKSLVTSNNYYASFGGVLIESSSTGLLNLIKDLNAGNSCAIQPYLKGASSKKDLHSLQTLADAGAFNIL